MANNKRKSSTSFTGSLLGIVMVVGVAMVAWFAISGIFKILAWIAPFLLIATLVMKWTVVVDYAKFILATIKENPVKGLLYGAGTFLGFPLVVAYLFFKALTLRQVEKRFGKKETKYAEYEEVEEQEVDDEDFLELPEIEKAEPTKQSSGNEYEDLF